MTEERRDLLERTKAFALRVVRLYGSIPRSTVAQVLGKQVLRSGTSVGAHLREAKRSRSDAELISKVEGALQELEETVYWIELLADSGIVPQHRLADLLDESDQLIAMLVTSAKTLKLRRTR